jgi:hypothetical protein
MVVIPKEIDLRMENAVRLENEFDNLSGLPPVLRTPELAL